VHAILESGPLVHKVQVRLNDSIGLIDDLDETLAIFDLKLRHMREDIAAIEARNNRCVSCATHDTQSPCCMTTQHCNLHLTSASNICHARTGLAIATNALLPQQTSTCYTAHGMYKLAWHATYRYGLCQAHQGQTLDLQATSVDT